METQEEQDIATAYLKHLKARLHATEQQRDALAAILQKCLQCIDTDGGASEDDGTAQRVVRNGVAFHRIASPGPLARLRAWLGW